MWVRVGAYGHGVGTTGVIFAAIAVAWLAYLVPHFVQRRADEPVDEADPSNRFSDSMRIIKHGTAPLLDQDLSEIGSYEVSTPLTRRAAIDDLGRLERMAARRRRRVLLALMLVLSAMVGVCAARLWPWWTVAIPGGLVLAFLAVARISVRGLRRTLEVRYQDICRGGAESTVFLSRRDLAKVGPGALGENVSATPIVPPGALWDPVPITMPTYVSKPLAPRTVRTIDLSGPELTASARSTVPVTADAPAGTKAARSHREGGETPQAASA